MEHSAFLFRNATVNDIDLLSELRVEFARSIHGTIDADVAERIYRSVHDYYHRHVAQNDYISILCFSGSEFAALGGMLIREQPGGVRNPEGRTGYLVNMYTREAFRRQGLCSTILNMLIARGQELGLHVFELTASAMGEQVYIKEGFTRIGDPSYRLVCS